MARRIQLTGPIDVEEPRLRGMEFDPPASMACFGGTMHAWERAHTAIECYRCVQCGATVSALWLREHQQDAYPYSRTPLRYLDRYPNGFWFVWATGEIVDSNNVWTDGQGRYHMHGSTGERLERVYISDMVFDTVDDRRNDRWIGDALRSTSIYVHGDTSRYVAGSQASGPVPSGQIITSPRVGPSLGEFIGIDEARARFARLPAPVVAEYPDGSVWPSPWPSVSENEMESCWSGQSHIWRPIGEREYVCTRCLRRESRA